MLRSANVACGFHAGDPTIMGATCVAEGFVDRGYTPAGHLVPRTEPGALVTDADSVVQRSLRMALDGEVIAVDGSVLPMRVSSLCVHGDAPGAVALATKVRAALEGAGVVVRVLTP